MKVKDMMLEKSQLFEPKLYENRSNPHALDESLCENPEYRQTGIQIRSLQQTAQKKQSRKQK
jgi:hypothetical protein